MGEVLTCKCEGRKNNLPMPEWICAHWAVYVAMIALKAGYSIDEVVGDQGILHEMIHVQFLRHDAYNNSRIKKIKSQYNQFLIDLGIKKGVRSDQKTTKEKRKKAKITLQGRKNIIRPDVETKRRATRNNEKKLKAAQQAQEAAKGRVLHGARVSHRR
jgi:hypothetical protein